MHYVNESETNATSAQCVELPEPQCLLNTGATGSVFAVLYEFGCNQTLRVQETATTRVLDVVSQKFPELFALEGEGGWPDTNGS